MLKKIGQLPVYAFILRSSGAKLVFAAGILVSCSDTEPLAERTDEVSTAPAEPSVLGLFDEGSTYRVELEGTEGLYVPYCGFAPTLTEVTPPANVGKTPEGLNKPYILNGEYYSNDGNLGCDVVGCAPLGESRTFSKKGVVSVGESSVGGAGGVGGAAAVPEFETYIRRPPFRLTLSYYADEECRGKRYTTDPIVLSELSTRE